MNNRYWIIASVFLLITISLIWWLQARRIEPVAITPTLTGQVEYCLSCHADLAEISPSHPLKTFGCVLCHGGERLALNADLAHSSMRGGNNPSALSVVEQSCGGENCHAGTSTAERNHIQRTLTSLQSTYAGAIANVRYTFGTQPDLTPLYGTGAVTDTSLPSKTGILHLGAFDPLNEANPSLKSFGANCLTCHLNYQVPEDLKGTRFTGCAACHSPVGGFRSGEVHILTTAMPYTHCNTCHNRGNYDLRTITFVERIDQPMTRLERYYQPIGQFTQCEYTLDCVDCHTRTEAMGDGDLHTRQKDFEYVRCATCHGTLTELPSTRTLTDPDDLAFRLAQVNPVVDLHIGDTILITGMGEPLWNTKVLTDGSYQMVGKATKQLFTFDPVMGSGCTQDGQDQSSAYCHECHAVER